MEELNKNQIVLLTLLISFITSIATGIVTVTLLDQAPPEVTQTINRVVERTVEKVVPGEGGSTVVKEVPVIVTEEELIVKAINNASPRVFRLMMIDKNGEKKQIGSAVYIDRRGYFATDASLFNDNPSSDYFVVDEDNNEYKAELATKGSRAALVRVKESSLAVFQKFYEDRKPLGFYLGDINVGQTVIGVGATAGGNHIVSVSIVSSLSGLGNATSTVMNTNAVTIENIGGPLLHIQGESLGINSTTGTAISIKEVKSLIDSIN